MKIFLTFSAILIFAAMIFTACNKPQASNTIETTKAVNAEPANAEKTANETKPAEKSDKFPPLPAAVAQTELKQLDGTTFKIGDKKGKVLLLNMWATWCGPCRAEMPEFIKLQDKYRDKNFEIVGLNVDDESAADITSFKEEMKLNYTLAWMDENAQKELLNISKFTGIPQSYLVDRDGNLRGVFVGGGPKVLKQLVESVEQVVNN